MLPRHQDEHITAASSGPGFQKHYCTCIVRPSLEPRYLKYAFPESVVTYVALKIHREISTLVVMKTCDIIFFIPVTVFLNQPFVLTKGKNETNRSDMI